jgi:hypothetical protein
MTVRETALSGQQPLRGTRRVVGSAGRQRCTAVSDPEPPNGSDDTGSVGWLTAFLSSTPRVIGSITALIGAISGLLIALNRVGVLGGDNADATPSKPAESLFNPVTRPSGRVYFDGTTMYVKAAQPRTPMLVLADQAKALQDVAMSTSVTWLSGASDYGYSLLCRYRNPRNYYLLGVLSGGRYNIARYRDGALTSLSRGLQHSDYLDEQKNDVTARCVGDDPTTLTLEANGRTVASIKDPTGLEGGNVGLRVGSGESTVTLAFEDFVLKYL